MSTVAILNPILALLVVVGIVSLLAWSIVADKAQTASRKPGAPRAETPRPSRLRPPRLQRARDGTA